MQVYTCARGSEDLQAALKEWQGRGWDVQGSVADLADPAAAAELMQAVKEAFGSKLHILGELKPAARRSCSSQSHVCAAR